MKMLILYGQIFSLHLCGSLLHLIRIFLLILLLEAYLARHFVFFLIDGVLRMDGLVALHILVKADIRLQ